MKEYKMYNILWVICMKILVILTGGTIGSIVHNGYIYTDETAKKSVLTKYIEKYGNDVEFSTLEPFTVHSENISYNQLNSLVKLVCENLTKDYDGIIVTHGTDSLQFTASALAYAVGNGKIPVLIVSANYALEDYRSNGEVNFRGAVDFIKNEKGTGVYIAYANDCENVNFIYGNRAIMFKEADDKVYELQPVPINSSLGKFELSEHSKVLTVDICPGLSYEYSLKNVKSVILRPYHSGTVNTQSQDFRNFVKRATEKNIPVYLVNLNRGNNYESVKEYEDIGIKALPFCAFPAIYMKAWIAGSINCDYDEFMQTSIAGEF